MASGEKGDVTDMVATKGVLPRKNHRRCRVSGIFITQLSFAMAICQPDA
jgi:hypothetical protein